MSDIVHLLDRSSHPPVIACGKAVSRPRQYTDDWKRATCRRCADVLPGLTLEQRCAIHENWSPARYAGNKPVPYRHRAFPKVWESCQCGAMQSHNWGAWFAAGEKAPVKKGKLHAPKGLGGCVPAPPKEKKRRARRAVPPASSNVVPLHAATR